MKEVRAEQESRSMTPVLLKTAAFFQLFLFLKPASFWVCFLIWLPELPHLGR